MKCEFETAVSMIPSASTAEFGPLLYGLVLAYKPSVIVEVGTLFGHTAAWLARGLATLERGRLYCIDDFSLAPAARESMPMALNALGLGDYVTVIEGRSDEVEWPAQVDLAFIDGSHTYEGCKADVEKAQALGARVVVVHDTLDWWGPRQFINEIDVGGLFGWDVMNVTVGAGIAVLVRHTEKPPVRFTRDAAPSGAIGGG